MPHINLLAWREASRKEAQKQFLSILFLVVILSFGSMFALSMFYSALKDGQNVRNNFLTSEIALLDQRIKDIRELDKRKASLQQRMRLIEELQSNIPLMALIQTLAYHLEFHKKLKIGASLFNFHCHYLHRV